jgi:hypothetical protein
MKPVLRAQGSTPLVRRSTGQAHHRALPRFDLVLYLQLLDAAKLGNLGLGGTGDGTGKGKGGGRGRKGKKGKKGKKGGDSDSESSDSSKDDDEEEEDDGDDEGGDGDKDDGNDAAAVLGGSKADGTAPKLFEGDAAGADNDDDDDDEALEEEEEEGGPWLMKEHPIFGRWFKMLADGKSKAEVLEELAKDKFNPALLDVPAAGEWLLLPSCAWICLLGARGVVSAA